MARVTSPTTRFTVDEFVRMAEADVFGTRRVELLDGRVHFMTQRELHMLAITRGVRALDRIRREGDWVISQGTLRLDRRNAPDPDLMLLPVREGTPAALWPMPVLLIEVSDTTYRKDAGIKARKYAAAGIADYWIVNLVVDRIEVYRRPGCASGRRRDWQYEEIRHVGRGESIALLTRPEVSLHADDLLP